MIWIGEGNGNPLQCSCLENPRDGGAWWAAVYGVAQSRTQLKRLSSSKCIWISKSVVVIQLFNHVQLMCDPTRLFCPQDFPGKNSGVGCCFLLQGMFLIQGLKLHLLQWQVDSLPLSPPGKPNGKSIVTVIFLHFISLIEVNYGTGDVPHSSTLAWIIPWTEEPGRLQSIGSLRVGHN